MGVEIERKFLVVGDGWRDGPSGVAYRQGYLSGSAETTVRVRMAGDRAVLTIKGPSRGRRRLEFEYPLPPDDAAVMLAELCSGPLIEKDRHTRLVDGVEWVIDEFHGDNAGLILAEVELTREDETITLPDWAGAEVSDDPRYYNAALTRHPFRSWPENR